MSTVLIDGGRVTVLPDNVYAMRVHDPVECAGRTCVVHAPTEHHMRSWRLHWRADRGIFERVCSHGVGHPDPDQQAYWREVGADREERSDLDDLLYQDGHRQLWADDVTAALRQVSKAPSRGAAAHGAMSLYAGAPPTALSADMLAAVADECAVPVSVLRSWAERHAPLTTEQREERGRAYASAQMTHGCDGCCVAGGAS